MFLANNRLFSAKSEALSGRFISLKWEAKDTYLVVPYSRAGGDVCIKQKRGLFCKGEVFFLLDCPLMGDPFTLKC